MDIILKGSENKLQSIYSRYKLRSVYGWLGSDESINQIMRTLRFDTCLLKSEFLKVTNSVRRMIGSTAFVLSMSATILYLNKLLKLFKSIL